jgi:glutathione S-transferase
LLAPLQENVAQASEVRAMKLYMHPVATTCRPVRLFIAENAIAVEESVVDILGGAQFVPPYSELNPNALVPMLEDGDLRLTESSAILKYLADKIDSPAYPKDLKVRAKVNEMMDWINTNFYRELGYALCYPQLFSHLKRRSDEAQAATLEIGKEQTKRWLKVLNDHWLGSATEYLCGGQLTIADYFGACLVSLGETIKIDYSAYPNVQRWLNTVAKLRSWPTVNEAFYDLVKAVKHQSFVTVP